MEMMSVYNNLPILFQNFACIYEGKKIKQTRYGKIFWQMFSEYMARSSWEAEKIISHRDARISEMVKHAYLTVPYYNQIFKEMKIDYHDIRKLEDLKLLPILTKKDVNKCPEKFISSTYSKKKLIKCHTSGTTGSGFVFYSTREAICEQWAVWWRYRKKLGIDYGTWCAIFGSKMIVPQKQNTPPYWRYNLSNHQIYFSGFHEKNDNLIYYFREIEKRKIQWIHGYPSLIMPLAIYMLDNNLKFTHKIKFVTTGAENLLKNQKCIMEKAFGVKPYEHYGLAEGVANFSENLNSEIIIDEDFAAVEFVDSEISGMKKIIGTNLTNYAMPLLRWDTKDLATVEKAQDFARRILSIDGRTEDYITLPDGTKVGKLDHAFKDTVNFAEVQLRQSKNFNLTVLIVGRSDKVDFDSDEKKALKLLRKSIGDSVEIQFKYVSKIEDVPKGKFRFVLSEIS